MNFFKFFFTFFMIAWIFNTHAIEIKELNEEEIKSYGLTHATPCLDDCIKLALALHPNWKDQCQAFKLKQGDNSSLIAKVDGPADKSLVFKFLTTPPYETQEHYELEVIRRIQTVFSHGIGKQIPKKPQCVARTLCFFKYYTNIVEVMESAPGDTLCDIFNDHKLPNDPIITIFDKAGKFLSVLHQQHMNDRFFSILHGDAHLGNLMVLTEKDSPKFMFVDAECSAYSTPPYGHKQLIIEDLLAFVLWFPYANWKHIQQKQLPHLHVQCVIQFLKSYLTNFDTVLRPSLIQLIKTKFTWWINTVKNVFQLTKQGQQRKALSALINKAQQDFSETTHRHNYFIKYENLIWREFLDRVEECKTEAQRDELLNWHTEFLKGLECLTNA